MIFIYILFSFIFVIQTQAYCPIFNDSRLSFSTFGDDTHGCYLYGKLHKDWGGADSACERIHHNELYKNQWYLASIHDAFTNSYLIDQLKSIVTNATNVWLGGIAIDPGRWTWTDNTTFDYQNFIADVNTSFINQTELETTIDIYSGKWYALPGYRANYSPYLCKNSKNYKSSKCPDGAFHDINPSDCYILNETRLDWKSAEKSCIARGGHLASIESYIHNEIIQFEILKKYNITTFWIGLESYYGPDYQDYGNYEWQWMWSDGTEFYWDNIGDSNDHLTNNTNGYFDMANGTWYSKEGDTKLPFLCKVPPITELMLKVNIKNY